MVIAMNTDDNSTNGFSGGEFLVVGGSIIQSSFNLPALLIDANFAPVNLLADFRLTNGDSLAEFSVRLNDLADPARITLSILVLDAAGVQLLDRMPERVPAFFSLASRYLVVPFDDPADFRVRFNSASLTPGFYDAALYLDSTDPASRTATVPIRMVVTNTTPVTLAEFSAAGTEAGVVLAWRTSGETDHAGFHVYRREVQGAEPAGADPGERLTGALIPPARDGRYTFVDRTALPGLPYAYTLADISRGGQIHFHGPVTTLAGPALPLALALAPVAPNTPAPADRRCCATGCRARGGPRCSSSAWMVAWCAPWWTAPTWPPAGTRPAGTAATTPARRPPPVSTSRGSRRRSGRWPASSSGRDSADGGPARRDRGGQTRGREGGRADDGIWRTTPRSGDGGRPPRPGRSW